MKKMTKEIFLERAHARWGDRWDYSETVYARSKSPVEIRCPEHGAFMQSPESHLKGYVGCGRCSGQLVDTAEFIRRSLEVWGTKWDYSKTEYVTNKRKVIVTCPQHGDFSVWPRHHQDGIGGCPTCGDRRRISPEDFLAKARAVWGDRWDYSKIAFVKTTEEVTINCHHHGEFTHTPKLHLMGVLGCKQCSSRTEEGFLLRAKEVWGDRWDYSKSSYDGVRTSVTMVCAEHGDFSQSPGGHLRKNVGCRSCKVQTSGSELELGEFLNSLDVEVEAGRRDLLQESRQEIDFYIPSKQVGFEFNGVYFHSEKFKDKNYHLQKLNIAQLSGIKLIQIWEDDWILRTNIVKEHIRQVLGQSTRPKVDGRDLSIQEISVSQAREFLTANHIQGFVPSSIYLGGTVKDELVAVASFRKQGENFLLARYATSSQVRGGHSKLIRHFEKNYTYQNLITFADLTFGVGGLYRSTGWVEDGLIPPDYSYLKNGVRQHKFRYRITKFKNDPTLRYEEGLTERELAKLNGLLRVYDAGKIRFIKPRRTT